MSTAKEIINKYKKKAALTNDLTYENYKNNDFYIEDLADNILIEKEEFSFFIFALIIVL